MNTGVFADLFEGGFAQGVLVYGAAAIISGLSVVLLLPFCRKAAIGLKASVLLSALMFCCLAPLTLMLTGAASPSSTETVSAGASPETIDAKTDSISAAKREELIVPMAVKVRPHEFNYFRIGGLLWLAGSAFLTLIFLRRCWRLKDALQSLSEPDSSSLRERFAKLKPDHLSHVRLLEGNLNQQPCCGGLRHPFVLVPADFEVVFGERDQDMILAHELGHLENRDVALSYFQAFASIFYWWNPLIQLMNRGLSLSREQLCDRKVVRESGDARGYASCLLKVVEHCQAKESLAGQPALGMSGEFRRLRKRVESVLSCGTAIPKRRRWRNGLAGCATICLLALVTLAFSRWELQAMPDKPRVAEHKEAVDPPAREGDERPAAKPSFTIKAESSSSCDGKTGTAIFEGNVEITIQTKGGKKVVITGAKGSYRQKDGVLEVFGPGVSVTFGGKKMCGTADTTKVIWDNAREESKIVGPHTSSTVR